MKKILKITFLIIIVFSFTAMTISCNGRIDIQEQEPVMEEESSGQEEIEVVEDERGNKIAGMISDTMPKESGHIMIGNIGDFQFNPSDIKTLREDIFNEGYFSIFDVLAWLDDDEQIEMEYHFDDDMNTYVIDSINDIENWWYIAYYDGGWPERNVFRMDHYPYKDKMYISVSEAEERELEEIYKVFRVEIDRKNDKGGKIVIPEVIVRTPTDGLIGFKNVEITAHDLRSDIFKTGTLTAIDAIMSLGDMGKINYTLNWYESVGTAGLVKNYFVDTINEDTTFMRCGFVYEEGSYRFEGFIGNHIHIPPDSRVINCPDYIEFFWICI